MVEIFKARTRAQWQQFAVEHDCCLEPVLELEEALESELVRAREMVVTLEQPGVAGGVRQLGIPVKLDPHPRRPRPPPRPRAGGAHRAGARRRRLCPGEIEALLASGAVAKSAAGAPPGATFRA